MATPRRQARNTPEAPPSGGGTSGSDAPKTAPSPPTPRKIPAPTRIAARPVARTAALPASVPDAAVVTAPAATPAKRKAKAPKKKAAAAAVSKAPGALVRDSFTMPQTDRDLIDILKTRALGFMRPVKKSELLRGGLHALAALNDGQLRARLDGLVPLKPGRRPKRKSA